MGLNSLRASERPPLYRASGCCGVEESLKWREVTISQVRDGSRC
jgi:hypothetical protein